MPENFQGSERYKRAGEAIDSMDSAIDSLDEAISSLESTQM